MKIKDHFLSQEEFEIIETEIQGIYKTSPLPDDLGKYYESKDYISHHQDSGSLKEKVYKFLQKFNLNYKKNIIKNEIGTHLKILDYGCGAGEFVKFIENEYTTFGFEPNENAKIRKNNFHFQSRTHRNRKRKSGCYHPMACFRAYRGKRKIPKNFS